MINIKYSLILLLGLLCFVSGLEATRFEAENAHVILVNNPEFKTQDLTSILLSEPNDRIIFTVNIPEDGSYPLLVHYKSNPSPTATHSHVQIRANGFDISKILLPHSSPIHKSSIPLRAGLNTVIIQNLNSSLPFSLDSIQIPNSLPLAPNGASLPYYEIEAEDAKTNGIIIGPSYTYNQLPSEASGRRAVQISQSQTINFTLSQPAAAIVIRYSIPDSSNGNGLYSSLSIFANSRQILSVPVNSHFSWIYGQYPFTKNPANGNPHHFFDETRAIFPSILAAGTVVTISGQNPSIVYTIDLVDFYFSAPIYPQPINYLSITQYGADPSGNRDSTSAIQNTLNAAASQRKNVFIPPGNFSVTSRFTVPNNIIIRGAGPWHSSIIARVNHGVGFFGNFAPSSSTFELYDFAMFGDTNVRDDSAVDSGCGGAVNSGILSNLWIEHTKCGMWFDGPFSSLHIIGVKIANTFADGINLHKSISNVVIEQCMIRNTGDDGLAIWSDASGGAAPDSNNVFKFNTIQIPVLANCIAIYGGNGNSATDNYVADSVYAGGGLQTSLRFGSTPFAGETKMARNKVVRGGAQNQVKENGAIWIWPAQGPMGGLITYEGIEIDNSPFEAISFWGGSVTNVHFNNVVVNGADYAVLVNSASGQAYFTNMVASNLRKGGVQSCDGGLQTSLRFGSTPFAGETKMARNKVVRGGAQNQVKENGAIWIWPAQGPMGGLITYEGIEIDNSPFEAISFWGGSVTNVHFNNVVVNGADYAVLVNSASGQAYFTNMVASNLRKGGVQSCDGGFKLVKVSGNRGWDDVHCN
eukprot:TRINITY_DN433_c0_g1_i1.p1 TRINITY_DN433_c0_g1~~TRINITY_DN433_c0_g1_i1.p1  ORF type:complete len:809 (+),score=206.82 TRINITY_DN433_c0_g1_i1:13-2439(+)